jgi:hypothetical protein
VVISRIKMEFGDRFSFRTEIVVGLIVWLVGVSFDIDF